MTGILLALGDPAKEALENFSIRKFDQFFVKYKMYESMFGHDLFADVITQSLRRPRTCPHAIKFFSRFVRCAAITEVDILFALKKALRKLRWLHVLRTAEFLCHTPLAEGPNPRFSPQTLMTAFESALPTFKAKNRFVVMVYQKKEELTRPFLQALMDWYNTNHTVR